jgi:hypothetical protein
VKEERVEWGDVYIATNCRVEYRENGSNEVNVGIGKCETGPWFFHDMEGEMMAKTNRAAYEIATDDGQYIYRVRMLNDEEVGAIWHNGKDLIGGVFIEDSTNLPAEIVSAYLKKVPSGMKKKDLYNKDYDAWCRVEIPRRIADLETLDWNAFMTETERGPNRDKWQRVAFTIGNLIRPVKDKTTPEDEEFFKWYADHLWLQPKAMKQRGADVLKEDLKALRKWWDEKKDVYTSQGRKHK